MDVEQRFRFVVQEACLSPNGVSELSPSVLAEAVVAVLPVDGAGISLTQPQLRVPLGWSDPDAAVAEAGQTTLGDGPCLTAAAEERALVVDAATAAARWPSYWAEIEQRTPYRSVAALPLHLGDRSAGQHVVAALELYAVRPDLSAVLSLEEARAVAEALGGMLFEMLDTMFDGGDRGVPAWLDDEDGVDRYRVWTAVGMVRAIAGLDESAALARLRAYAYSHGLTLDDTADRLLERDLQVDAVLD